MGAFVKALLPGQLDQLLVLHLLVVNAVKPEIATFAGVIGDGFAVLTGDCDLHDENGKGLWGFVNNASNVSNVSNGTLACR